MLVRKSRVCKSSGLWIAYITIARLRKRRSPRQLCLDRIQRFKNVFNNCSKYQISRYSENQFWYGKKCPFWSNFSKVWTTKIKCQASKFNYCNTPVKGRKTILERKTRKEDLKTIQEELEKKKSFRKNFLVGWKPKNT